MVFAIDGGFHQTLPVVCGGTRANEVDVCFKASKLWAHAEVLHLTTNMSIQLYGNTLAGTFANVLLSTGAGKFPLVLQ